MRILSLGAGVQSTTVLLLSLLGELPRIDCAIFADTQWEPGAVYSHLAWLEGFAARHGVPVYRVTKGNIRKDSERSQMRARKSEGGTYVPMPFYTTSAKGKPGIVSRQCTKNYKVLPVEREIRRLLGLKPRAPWPKYSAVELWFGISADETRRVRLPGCRWKTHRYPLVYERRMRRSDCLRWLADHGFPEPPRSACLGCPFHSDAEWRRIKQNPAEWDDVIEFDGAIRGKGGPRGELFLHPKRLPLVQIDLSTPEERGQLSLGFDDFREECLGYCGV